MNMGLKGKSVLIIDDELDFLELIKLNLELYDLKVTTATNGIEGLDLIVRNNFDYIICDVRMPQLDGVELFKRMRSLIRKSPPFFFFTAFADYSIDEIRKWGACDVIPKPFNIHQLMIALRNCSH